MADQVEQKVIEDVAEPIRKARRKVEARIAELENASNELRELRAEKSRLDRALKALGGSEASKEPAKPRAARGAADRIVLACVPKDGEEPKGEKSIIDHAEALSKESDGPARAGLRKAFARLLEAGRIIKDGVNAADGDLFRREADADGDAPDMADVAETERVPS